MIGAIFMPPTFLFFIVIFSQEDGKNIRIVKFAFIINTIFILMLFSPSFVRGVERRLFFPYWPIPGILFTPFLVAFYGVSVYTFILLYKIYKRSFGIRRNQLKYIFLGTFIGAIGGSTNYFLWYNIPIPPLGNILISTYVFLIGYAIIKYQLMDIKIAVTRAGIFLIIYAFILGFPFWLGYNLLGWGVWIMPFSILVIAATLGPFIYNYLRRWAEAIILKEQVHYQKILKKVVSSLIDIRDVEKLAKKVVSEIVKSVKLDFCAIYLKETEDYYLKNYTVKKPLEFPEKIDSQSEFIRSFGKSRQPISGECISKLENINLGLGCPLYINQQLSGFILLSQKGKGEIFTETDMDLFFTLSVETSLALSEIYYIKKAKESEREKQEIIAQSQRINMLIFIAEVMTDEIKNALAVISGNAQLVLMDETDSNTKETIQKIIDAGERLHKDLHMLDIIASAKDEAEAPLDINRVIDEALAVEVVKNSFRANNINIEKEYALKDRIVFQRKRMLEILIFLFITISRRMGVSGGSIKISTRQNQGDIELAIKDSGPPIPKEAFKDKYKAFYEYIKVCGTGTGLGLFAAINAIEKTGGTIFLENTDHTGVELKINLPVKEA